MNSKIFIFAILATVAHGSVIPLVASPTLFKAAPQYNSVIVQSDRVGGNFAYSIQEGQAYHSASPVISNEIHPVVTYQWAGGVPFVGPQYVFQPPLVNVSPPGVYYPQFVPIGTGIPGALPPPPPSASGQPQPQPQQPPQQPNLPGSSNGGSPDIETVSDEADDDAVAAAPGPSADEPIQQEGGADETNNDDTVAVESA